jgi:hypothetical protein
VPSFFLLLLCGVRVRVCVCVVFLPLFHSYVRFPLFLAPHPTLPV